LWFIKAVYRGADKSLARPGRKQATATEDFDVRISYTLYDHKAHDSIRRELQITSTLDKIDEYRLNWLLHLQRMPKNRIPVKSYHYRPQGRKNG
jgi:hypothetical protein